MTKKRIRVFSIDARTLNGRTLAEGSGMPLVPVDPLRKWPCSGGWRLEARGWRLRAERCVCWLGVSATCCGEQ